MSLHAPLMQAHATCSKESSCSVNRKVDSALLLKTPLESSQTQSILREYNMNKMIVALIAGLFVSGAAFATEASAPVVASGASAAKATSHKKAHKSKKAAKAASAAPAASAAQ
ncbi:hypothetical protein LMG28138_00187 [Pararobbsia alpina]|uniref:Acid shock protein n=2 Tax=Pararobbsia alpina TaxID=621374 RepID=A0A6S7ASP1_9BURK|nr:hypothetical protein LMG28138_00187 [Pararobbsia alpina]